MHFYHALKQSPSSTVNGTTVRSFGWEDDGEDGLALRVISEDDQSILIYNTDRIVTDKIVKGRIVASIGATDHVFIV
jgi:putative lipase involved disintegration of autophagic bodies